MYDKSFVIALQRIGFDGDVARREQRARWHQRVGAHGGAHDKHDSDEGEVRVDVLGADGVREALIEHALVDLRHAREHLRRQRLARLWAAERGCIPKWHWIRRKTSIM